MDYNKILRAALDSGVTLDQIMTDISNAANKIEKEDAERRRKQRFAQPLAKEGEDFIGKICNEPLSQDSMAVIYAHFLESQVPGLCEWFAENDMNVLEEIKKTVAREVELYKIAVIKSEEDTGKRLLDFVIEEVAEMLKA